MEIGNNDGISNIQTRDNTKKNLLYIDSAGYRTCELKCLRYQENQCVNYWNTEVSRRLKKACDEEISFESHIK